MLAKFEIPNIPADAEGKHLMWLTFAITENCSLRVIARDKDDPTGNILPDRNGDPVDKEYKRHVLLDEDEDPLVEHRSKVGWW